MIDHITVLHLMSLIVLHLDFFACKLCVLGFCLDFLSIFMLHVIWFSEMIAYVNAMFDIIDFHRRVTNSSIK